MKHYNFQCCTIWLPVYRGNIQRLWRSNGDISVHNRSCHDPTKSVLYQSLPITGIWDLNVFKLISIASHHIRSYNKYTVLISILMHSVLRATDRVRCKICKSIKWCNMFDSCATISLLWIVRINHFRICVNGSSHNREMLRWY